MKRFYMPVDLRSRTAMTEYLQNHFRYPTMNSWNRSESYACNLKITHLGLTSEIVDKLFDMIVTQEFFSAQRKLMNDFGEDHQYRWQVGMNGRNGGYLVLYQGDLKPSGYKSFCTHCGQRNYKTTAESGTVCGRCGQPKRVDYSKPPMEVVCYPGRGTDDGEDYEDWSIEELRSRVKLVQELDKLADSMVEQAVMLANTCTVEEEEYFIPQTRKVLVSSI